MSNTTGPRALSFTRTHWPAVVVAVIVVAVPVLAAAVTGNLSIPHNDAWGYSRIAQTFATTGRYQLLGWGRMALVGQAGVLGWLGHSITLQQLAVSALSVVLLLSAYSLLIPRIGRTRAAIAIAIIAIYPGYALLSTSFMTDVPALALALLCLALGDIALKRDSVPLFVLASAVGTWAVAIRIQSAAGIAALFLYALITLRNRSKVRWIALLVTGIIVLVVTANIYKWTMSLPGQENSVDTFTVGNARYASLDVLRAVMTLGLALLPAALLSFRPSRWRWRSAVGAAAGLAIALLAIHSWGVSQAFALNYLSPSGAYSGVFLGPRQVFPPGVWMVIVVLGVIGAVIGGGELGRKISFPRSALAWFGIISAIGLVLADVLGQAMYDRYILAVVPSLLAVLLRPEAARDVSSSRATRRVASLPSAVAFVVVGTISVAVALNAFAFDITRWHIGEQLVATGVPPTSVDVGLEWLGISSPNGVTDIHASVLPPPIGWFGTEWRCYTAYGGDKLAGFTRIQTVPYRTFLIFGHSQLYVFHHSGGDCV